MIRSWEGMASDVGSVSERDTQQESPLPQSAVGGRGEGRRGSAGAGEGGRGSAVCEGPFLSALLNKIETLLDQVCVGW